MPPDSEAGAAPRTNDTDLESAQLKSKPGMHRRGDYPEGHVTLENPQTNSVNARTVQLVKLLSEVGPDVPAISRRLGQFKESVRYRYKEKILNRGFAVQAVVDHEKLGLQRMVAVLDFAEPYRKYAQSILWSMSELCFLVSFAKTMPTGYYITAFSVPEEFLQELKHFLETLKVKGFFTRLETLDFDWVRTAPMKAEYYDFDTGRWDFDWSNKIQGDFGTAKYTPAGRSKYDYVDLLIIKELQMDANKSMREISDKIKVNYKKLAWHYMTHIADRKLIRMYSVNWMGTRYDYGMDRALHRQHRYMGILVVVRAPSEFETIAVRQELDRLPFLWSEFVGQNYSAFLTFPVDSVVEGFQYLTGLISKIRDKAEIYFIDQSEATSFSIPYARFDATAKCWTFDEVELVNRFDRLTVEIRDGSG
jgi:hypothetical protein